MKSTKSPICPYCRKKQDIDLSDLEDESELTCEGCGEIMRLDIIDIPMYVTSKKIKIPEEHFSPKNINDWEPYRPYINKVERDWMITRWNPVEKRLEHWMCGPWRSIGISGDWEEEGTRFDAPEGLLSVVRSLFKKWEKAGPKEKLKQGMLF